MSGISKSLKEFIKSRKKERQKNGYKLNEDGKAKITVGAEKYDDIFSPYCYKGGDILKAELVDYIEEKADCVPLNVELELEFRVKEANESKLEEIKEAFERNYKTEIRQYNNQLKNNNFFSLMILLLGLCFYGVYVSLENIVSNAVGILLEIVTWVFIWEAIDAFFLERRMIKLEIVKRYRLLNADLKVKEFEPY